MTSLRAISTLLKKTKVFLLLLFILSSSLWADSFFYALDGESEKYCSLLSSVLSSFTVTDSSWAIEMRDKRREREENIEEKKRITLLSQKEEVVTLKEKSDGEDDISLLNFEKVSLDLKPFSSFLSNGDKEAYDYLLAKNNLDAIIYVKSTIEDSIEKIDLIINSEVVYSTWFNDYLVESERKNLYQKFSSLLLGDSYNLYKINLTPSDMTLFIDGKSLANDRSYIVLKNGEHNFSLSSYGYKPYSFSRNFDGEESEINLSLEKSEPISVYVSTLPYDAKMTINGEEIKSKRVDGIYTPFTITLERDGFLPYSYQTNEIKQTISLSMEPQWSENAGLLESNKGEFYRCLFYLLLSFGGYTATNSIENFISPSISRVSKVVFTGCSFVSLIRLIQSAYDYYNSSRMGL